MTTAPSVSSITAGGASAWAGAVWNHDSNQDVDDANILMKVFEKTGSNSSRGFVLIYYKTGAKAGKQYVNVNLPNPDNNSGNPGSIENVTQSTGGQSGTDEVEYTTGDQLKFWDPGYQYPLIDITTDATWQFTSGSSSGGGPNPLGNSDEDKPPKVFCNFW